MARNYIMSFSTGGLFYSESLQIAALYGQVGQWDAVFAKALEENILHSRVLSSAKRTLREIIGRLKTLGEDELVLLAEGTASEQRYLLWLAVCRRYTFVREFAIEVVRERYLTLQYDLPKEEFGSFFNAKERIDERLEQIKESTRKKLRNVLFKMMREAEIIDSSDLILPAMLSKRFVNVVARNHLEDLTVFPIAESDIERMLG